MNKPAVQAHYAGVLAELTGPVQPQIDSSLELLVERHQIPDGPLVDIYGESDCGYGYEAQDICITGTTVSLYGLLADRFVDGKFRGNGLLQSLSAMCDETLPSAAEKKEESRQEALIDRAQERKESHW